MNAFDDKPVMNQQLFDVVFNQNVMGMAVRAIDPVNSRWLRVNQKFCDMLGYTREELLNLTSVEISFPGEQHHAVHYNELLLSGEVKSYSREKRYIRKDGNVIWTNIWLSSVPDESGKPGQIISVFHDITDQKNAEVALAQSESRLRAILDNSPACLNLKDLDGHYIYANKQYEEWWGRNLDDIIGKHANEFHTDRNGVRILEAAEKRVLETGVAQENEVTVHRTDTGKIHDRLLIKFPVKTTEDEIIGLGTFAIDITERKQAEAELVRHRDHLQEMVNVATQDLKQALQKEVKLNELQQQFVSMVSHEFRTPLSIIDGSVQRLSRMLESRSLNTDRTGSKLNKIRVAVRRMTRLMESTLTAARLSDGQISINVAPCSVGALIAEVCETQRELSDTQILFIDVDDLPDEIVADCGAVEQILNNLISNAMKYSAEDPRIEIKGWQENNCAMISVRDYGIGIDRDDIGRIGERFFRARSSTGIAGTGIGLNLVKALVKLHGGQLDITSAIGRGSTFTIRLPISGPKHMEAEKITTPSAA